MSFFNNFSNAGILKSNLAAALQDEAQQAINAYLGADTKELEQRWFYGNKYAKYPDQLIKAAQLLGEQHFFYNTITGTIISKD